MASIFTYDPNPPRVSSPWISSDDSALASKGSSTPMTTEAQPGLLSEYGVTKLQAEPQSGPTEYKLHLLLRPRRTFTHMSTISQDSKTFQTQAGDAPAAKAPVSAPAASNQPRQQRLQHLTTQLLWRLQQSSPYHASSSKELTIPRLPDDSVNFESPVRLGALVPGLEESRGALYEIGVSDDGTLVGLTKDEMDESVATLRVMAASLGCRVDIVRMVIVGDCEWVETGELIDNAASTPVRASQQGRLWVAEALVTPNIGLRDSALHNERNRGESMGVSTLQLSEPVAMPSRGSSTTPQLRVTLTGPTTSGKSSLLGTLSTGTLDNGRGKSRLSLLKHRHEMASGVTSSIAQELIGYKDKTILNFSHGNIESWIDIHDYSEKGRLVFVSDSGGHPRYRRTVLRGLMNWDPHWSILCIAADDAEVSSSGYGMTSPAQDVGIDLVSAHLTLSLKLNMPMAVVITKLDLASKLSLQKTMIKVLAAVKDAGRIPKILQPDQRQHDQLDEIPQEDYDKVQTVVEHMTECGSLTKHVPIMLTSALKGTGIGLVHALLGSLPLPPAPTARDCVGMALNPEQPKCLFHIDDTFTLPKPYSAPTGDPERRADQGIVVSGHIRFGSFSVGDTIVVGPFPPDDEYSRSLAPEDRPPPGGYGLSISHPSSAELARIATKNAVSASTIVGEWHNAHIVSARNLRLPVRTLEAGQAGSIGLVFESDQSGSNNNDEMPRIRRGMVIAIPSKHMLDVGISLQAASGFTAAFNDVAAESLSAGSFVNVFVACARAAARVLRVSTQRHVKPETTKTDEIDIFNLHEEMEYSATEEEEIPFAETTVEVSLELLHNREWVELGSQVIIMEGGSQDRSGLEGFVGKITEIVD